MIPKSLLASAALSLTFLSSGASAGFMSLYAFGDSLSDSGNLYNIVYAASSGTIEVPPPPYYQGRASNGPVAVEYLAARLGLSAQPVIASDGSINPLGTNFAILGSATGPVSQVSAIHSNYMTFRYDPALPDVGINDQINTFAGLSGGAANPGALYFYWGGANDAYLALEDPDIDHNDLAVMNGIATTTGQKAAQNVANNIGALAVLGARTFLVPNLPDLGLTPDAQSGIYGTAYATALTTYTNTFNAALDGLMDPLDADPLLRVVEFDMASVFDDLFTSGLYNVTDECIIAGPACDPSTYLFWDGVHPTTFFHARLGDLMAQAVPEPASLGLLASGLILIRIARGRRG